MVKMAEKQKDWYEECYDYGEIDSISRKYPGKLLISERDRNKGLRAIVLDPQTYEILAKQKIPFRIIRNFTNLARKFEFKEGGPDIQPVFVQYLDWRKKNIESVFVRRKKK